MELTRRYFAESDNYRLMGYQQDAALIVYKLQDVCKNSILALGFAFCRFVG